MATSSFARARQFLNYNSSAKWLALVAGAGTGVLYVCFLFLLILFADILANRGNIPTLDHLSPYQRYLYLRYTNAQQKADWPERLKEVPSAKNLSDDDINKIMTEPEKGLTQSHRALRKTWTIWWEKEQQKVWTQRLKKMGYDPEEVSAGRFSNLVGMVAKENTDQLLPRQRELHREIKWRWFVYEYLENNVGSSAVDYVREQTKQVIERVGPQLALDRDIPNCGVLSLLVRSHDRLGARIGCRIAAFNPWMWAYGMMDYLLGLLIIAFVLAGLRAVLMYVSRDMAARVIMDAATRLRRAIYHHTYRLGTLAFRALGPTEAVGVSTRHLEAVLDGMYNWLTVYFREPIKFALLLAFALLVNPWLTLAFVLLALLVWMVGGQIAAYFRRRGRMAGEVAAEQLALMQESLMLMRLVKVYLMELFNQTRVERQLASSAEAQMGQYRCEAIYRPLLILLGMIGTLTLFYVIGVIVAYGRLGIPGAIVLTTALVSLYLPAQKWLEQRRFLRRARESAGILFEFLDRKGEVGQDVEAVFLPPLEKKLEFKNVSLKEPGTGRKLLRNINLTIEAGQRVALVGPDDMEKHSLVYLLPRFLDPSSGEILIDGKNLRWVTLESLRAQIGMVLQHNLVFNDTVANNISCGEKSFSLPQIIEVAKTAHAHQFIQKLPKGYETMIGEMGHSLSASQRFRIALARAILRDPALMIIEEPLIPLDEEIKDLLDDTMTRVLPGRTVIFMPHRLSTIRHCDKVFLLFNGEIAATGEHKELISQNDLYRHLQYLEFNEFAGVVGKPMLGGML